MRSAAALMLRYSRRSGTASLMLPVDWFLRYFIDYFDRKDAAFHCRLKSFTAMPLLPTLPEIIGITPQVVFTRATADIIENKVITRSDYHFSKSHSFLIAARHRLVLVR